MRAVVLTATGRGFCAGVDIKEMQTTARQLRGSSESTRPCFELFRAVYECAVPVIAAVNDFCLGTGIGIAGNADIVDRRRHGVGSACPRSTTARSVRRPT